MGVIDQFFDTGSSTWLSNGPNLIKGFVKIEGQKDVITMKMGLIGMKIKQITYSKFFKTLLNGYFY